MSGFADIAAGVHDAKLRGRWVAHDASFCDLVVRTGMQLSEQTALTVFGVPTARGVAVWTFLVDRLSPKVVRRAGSTF